MATARPRPADATETAGAPATRGNARALARRSKWSGSASERGSASAPRTNSPQRNTSTSAPLVTAATGGRGSAPAPTTGSAATRASTTPPVDTRATGAIGAEFASFQPNPTSVRTCGRGRSAAPHLIPAPRCAGASMLTLRTWEKDDIYSVKMGRCPCECFDL